MLEIQRGQSIYGAIQGLVRPTNLEDLRSIRFRSVEKYHQPVERAKKISEVYKKHLDRNAMFYLIDDDSEFLSQKGSSLSELGYDMFLFRTAVEASRVYEFSKDSTSLFGINPDLVLTDLVMVYRMGTEVIAEVERSGENAPEVLLVTGLPVQQQIQEFYNESRKSRRMPIQEFRYNVISKPVDDLTLMNAVNDALETRLSKLITSL